MDFVSIAMIVMLGGAFGTGLAWARYHINKDVKTLYATRPLSNQQIEALNAELRELKKSMGPMTKD
jgi:hypothetical protein